MRSARLTVSALTLCLAGMAQAAVDLTPAEQAFLQRHPVVTLGAGVSFDPFVVRNADGSLDGFDVAVAKRVQRHTGLRIEFELAPWDRMVRRAKVGEVDGLTAAIMTADRAPFLTASKAYFTGARLVLVPAGNPAELHRLDDLNGKRVALHRGNALFGRAAQQLFTDLTMRPYDTLDEVVMAVARREADFALLDETAPALAGRLGVQNAVEFAFAVGQPHRLHFLVRKDWPEAVSIINKGLAAIPEADLRALRRAWFGDITVRSDRRLVWQVVLISLLTLTALLYWAWTLRRGRRRAEQLLAEVRARDLALELANAELRATAETDHLTGLPNRAQLDRLLLQARAGALPFVVLLADLDHFKRVNDRLGHLAGDQVLKAAAGLLTQAARADDVIGRWGGEEFLVISAGASITDGAALAERLRAAFEAHPWRTVEHQTISVGVTLGRPGEPPNTVVGRADAALYQAKAGGRNRVASSVHPKSRPA